MLLSRLLPGSRRIIIRLPVLGTSSGILRNSGSSFLVPLYHRHRAFHTTSPAAAVKTVEILSLGSSTTAATDTTTTTTATVVALPVQKGSRIEAGDLLAQVKTAEGVLQDIRSPLTGTLVQVHTQLHDSVQVGDAPFAIDTDGEAADSTPESIKAVQEHVRQQPPSSSTIDPAFVQSLLNTNVTEMRQLAAALLNMPQHIAPAKVLTVYEHILSHLDTTTGCSKETDKDDLLLQSASVYTDIGILSIRLGDLDGAVTYLQRAVELRNGRGPVQELIASSIHLGTVQRQTGHLQASKNTFDQVLELQTESLGESHPQVAVTWNQIGALHLQAGAFAPAVECYRRALQIFSNSSEQTPQLVADTATCHQNLGHALKQSGDYAGAVEHGTKALEIRQQVLPTRHADLAASYASLGQLLLEMGQFVDAAQHLQSALVIQEETAAADDDNNNVKTNAFYSALAATYNSLGAAYYMQQDFPNALAAYQKGLAALQAGNDSKGTPVTPPSVLATALNNVGAAQYQTGDLDDALVSHRRARELLTEILNDSDEENDNATLAATIGSIGNILKRQGHLEEALDEYKTSHVMLEKTHGEIHSDVASSYNNMGQVLAAQGKMTDALEVYRAAEKIFREALGTADHPNVAACRFNCGLVLLGEQDKINAKEEFQGALEIWTKTLGPEHPQTALAKNYVQEAMS